MLFITRLIVRIPMLRWLYLFCHRHQAYALVPLIANPTHRQRQQRCLWCWNEKHHDKNAYPYRTSSMCVKHSTRQRAALATSRAARHQEVAV